MQSRSPDTQSSATTCCLPESVLAESQTQEPELKLEPGHSDLQCEPLNQCLCYYPNVLFTNYISNRFLGKVGVTDLQITL